MTLTQIQKRLQDLQTIYRGLSVQHARALRDDKRKEARYIRVEIIATGKAVKRLTSQLDNLKKIGK